MIMIVSDGMVAQDILSFNHFVLEIRETKMPLICKSLAQGQTVPHMLEAVVYGKEQGTCFHSRKQACLTNLHRMCLITC